MDYQQSYEGGRLLGMSNFSGNQTTEYAKQVYKITYRTASLTDQQSIHYPRRRQGGLAQIRQLEPRQNTHISHPGATSSLLPPHSRLYFRSLIDNRLLPLGLALPT